MNASLTNFTILFDLTREHAFLFFSAVLLITIPAFLFLLRYIAMTRYQKDQLSSIRTGLLYNLIACAMFAIMSACVYQTKLWDPSESSLTASFIRIAVNFVIVLLFAIRRHGAVGPKLLLGDGRWSLWARGFFGGLSLMSMFYAVQGIGIGETSFLQASNALWITLLGPLFLDQKNSRSTWAAVVLGLIGTYLVYQPELAQVHLAAKTLAVASGLMSAIAYMMIARAGRSNSSLTVVFYLCLVTFALHIVWFMFFGFTPPHDVRSWILLIFAGVSGSIAQIFMTKAYQRAPAALVSATSYSQPVISLAIAATFFASIPNSKGLLGALIVVFSGVAIPLIKQGKSKV